MLAAVAMDDGANPTRSSLRLLLQQLMPTDTDLRSLCIDHLPELLPKFSTSMSYDALLNIVLEQVPSSLLLRVLAQSPLCARTFALHQHVLQFAPHEGSAVVATKVPDSGPPGRRVLPPPRSAFDATWYVPRSQEEEQALDALEYPGAAVVLMGAEAFGKTWLLERILSLVQGRGRVVNLNLRAFGHADIMASYSRFLREFARQILVDACGVPPDQAASLLDEAWRYSDNPIDNLNSTMKRHVLGSFTEGRWLIIALDGIEALSRHPYLEDFFTLLRNWMENAGRPLWSSLRLLLSLAMPPRLLITNVHQSPFNIATYVYLDDLSPDQVTDLARLYALAWSPAERQQVMELIGGHPYLLRLAMNDAVRHGHSVAEITAPQSRVFADFLGHSERFLRANPPLREAMLRALADARATIDFESFDRLQHAGLLLRDEPCGLLRPRCALYRRLLRHAG